MGAYIPKPWAPKGSSPNAKLRGLFFVFSKKAVPNPDIRGTKKLKQTLMPNWGYVLVADPRVTSNNAQAKAPQRVRGF